MGWSEWWMTPNWTPLQAMILAAVSGMIGLYVGIMATEARLGRRGRPDEGDGAG